MTHGGLIMADIKLIVFGLGRDALLTTDKIFLKGIWQLKAAQQQGVKVS